MKPPTKIDWSKIDWSRKDAHIARDIGRTRELVRQMRIKTIPQDRYKKPFDVVLEPTIIATMKKYHIGAYLAEKWHKDEGMPIGKRGPKCNDIPPDFIPGKNIRQDARRMGVSDFKMRSVWIERGYKKVPGPYSWKGMVKQMEERIKALECKVACIAP